MTEVESSNGSFTMNSQGVRGQIARELSHLHAVKIGRLFYEAPMGLVIGDSNRRFTAVNHAFCKLLGYTEEELLGKSLVDITHPDDVAHSLELSDQITRIGAPIHYCKRLVTRSGHVIWGDIHNSILRDKAGKTLYSLGFVQDVTESKIAHEKLENLSTALACTNQELEQFAFMAAHDLKEPLRTLSTALQFIKRQHQPSQNDTVNQFLAYAVDSAARMHQLIDNLLAVSCVGRGSTPSTRVNLNVVLQIAQENLNTLITERGAKIVCESPLPTVVGYHLELVQLFQNLISNAIKFCSQSFPFVTISFRRARDQWLFAIADNGVGISSDDSKKLFGMFQRLGPSAAGSGIGLAICKKIVGRHGGRIWVKSQISRGSTFYFTLSASK